MIELSICTKLATGLDSLNNRLRRPSDDDYLDLGTDEEHFKGRAQKFAREAREVLGAYSQMRARVSSAA